MGLIHRHFTCFTFTCFTSTQFYFVIKGLVRPHLEYANVIWSPILKRHISLKMHDEKQLDTFRYQKQLEKLNLPTLKYHRFK